MGMTPDFSRAAAQIVNSPYWQGALGFDRWHAFLKVIQAYPTFAALPDTAKAEWRTAELWQRENHTPDPW